MTEFKPRFDDFSRDIDRWMDRFGEMRALPSGAMARFGLGKATDYMLEQYFANEAFDPLISYYGGAADWRNSPVYLRLLDALARRLKRLFAVTLGEQKSAFWRMRAFCRTREAPLFNPERDLPLLARDKARVLDTLDYAADLLRGVGEAAYADRLIEERGRIEREEPMKLAPPLDREMDEAAFWELIEGAARNVEAPSDWTERLTEGLQAVKPTEIAKFEKVLRAQMEALNTWGVLALAHLAGAGGSDDGFEYFRAWLIFQGREVCAAAAADVESLAGRVPYGGGRVEGLASVAPNAYENRSGRPVKPAKVKDRKMAGAPWTEAELPARFPRLAKALAA